MPQPALTPEVAAGDRVAGAVRGDGDADDGAQQVREVLAPVERVLLLPAVSRRPVQVVATRGLGEDREGDGQR